MQQRLLKRSEIWPCPGPRDTDLPALFSVILSCFTKCNGLSVFYEDIVFTAISFKAWKDGTQANSESCYALFLKALVPVHWFYFNSVLESAHLYRLNEAVKEQTSPRKSGKSNLA